MLCMFVAVSPDAFCAQTKVKDCKAYAESNSRTGKNIMTVVKEKTDTRIKVRSN